MQKKALYSIIKEEYQRLLNEAPPTKNPVPAVRSLVKAVRPSRLPIINPNILRLGTGIEAATTGIKATKAPMAGEFTYDSAMLDPDAIPGTALRRAPQTLPAPGPPLEQQQGAFQKLVRQNPEIYNLEELEKTTKIEPQWTDKLKYPRGSEANPIEDTGLAAATPEEGAVMVRPGAPEMVAGHGRKMVPTWGLSHGTPGVGRHWEEDPGAVERFNAGLDQAFQNDPNLPNKLRAIALLPTRPGATGLEVYTNQGEAAYLTDDMVRKIWLRTKGPAHPFPENLSPEKMEQLKAFLQSDLAKAAAGIEHRAAIRRTETLGHEPWEGSKPKPDVRDWKPEPLQRGGERGQVREEYKDIGNNVENLFKRDLAGQKYGWLEPTAGELATGIPDASRVEHGVFRNLESHKELGLGRMKRMSKAEHLHPSLSPKWFGTRIESALLRSLERMPERSLTTDEIVDMASTGMSSYIASDLEGIKRIIDMYRWLEAAGQLPYQQGKVWSISNRADRMARYRWREQNPEGSFSDFLKQYNPPAQFSDQYVEPRGGLRVAPGKSSPIPRLDESKINNFIKEEYQKLLKELK